MNTNTEQRIQTLAVWSALAVYFAIWLSFISDLFKPDLLLPALGISFAYIAMHVYEISRRGHCYLSADSTALPVTLLLLVSGSLLAHFYSDIHWADIIQFSTRLAAAFLIGHIAALAYSAIFGALATRLLQRRIASEHAE